MNAKMTPSVYGLYSNVRQ